VGIIEGRAGCGAALITVVWVRRDRYLVLVQPTSTPTTHDTVKFRIFLSSFFLPSIQQGMVFETDIRNPGHVPLDVENYPLAPPTLRLEQVHLFVRHGAFWQSFVCLLPHSPCSGERLPVSIRMSGPPANIPSTWLLCKEGRKFEAAVANLTGVGTLRVERVVEKEDGSLESGEW